VATIELTETELMEAARGQRALRQQALADAERQGSSSTRTIFEQSAKFHDALASKFERARANPTFRNK
jgi:hypothetical protein